MQAAMKFINVDLAGLEDHEAYLKFCQSLEDLLARFHTVFKIHLSAASPSSPFFGRFCQRFHSRGLQLFCVTNAIWDQEILDSLWEVPLEVLGFWVESTHTETNEELRPGEGLSKALQCFRILKERDCSTKTVFYTNFLEENLSEISRIYNFVQHQPWVDHLLLQFHGTQTPAQLREFRDLSEVQGTSLKELPSSLLNFLWKMVSEETVLLNPMEQIGFWRDFMKSSGEELGSNLSLNCASGVPFALLSFKNGLQYHCPRFNESSHYFHSDEFHQLCYPKIQSCTAFCHFRWNYLGQKSEKHLEQRIRSAFVL